MASIELDAKSNQFHIRFRFAGRAFKRSLKTDNRKEAAGALARVEETLALVRRGVLALPEGGDLAEFIVTGGKCWAKPSSDQSLTLGELFRKYHGSLPHQAKEPSTLKTESTHIRKFQKGFPLSKRVEDLTTHDVQQFINHQSRLTINGRPISPDTTKRHINTLKSILSWAKSQQLIVQSPNLAGLIFGKRDEKLPFMTRAEIEKIVERGGLTDNEIDDLWECLYLTLSEVHEVLDLVRNSARYPFVHPMFAFVAYTGARRSEIIRTTIDDLDAERGTLLIRERKRSRQRSTTFRRVELPSVLVSILREWLQIHPGGRYLFAHNFSQSGSSPTKPLTVDQARSQFNKALRKTKWNVVRGFHVFRHSYASNLATLAVDQRIIDLHMGHQTEEMRKRYQHLIPAVCKKAMEVLSS